MGSFANSLHVRANDAGRVADVLRQMLTESGYVATDKEPKTGPFQSTAGPQRAVVVCEARQGWVGVLDSDFAQLMTFGQELSGRLATYAIQLLVNDSDAWIYALYQNGRQLDEFDSSEIFGGDEDGDDDFDGRDHEAEEDFTPGGAMISAADWSALQPKLNERMAQEQQRMLGEMPADIRAIQEKIQRGVASGDEIRTYSEWAHAQTAKVMENIKDIFPTGMLPGAPPPAAPRPKLSRDADGELREHLEKLRPILAPGVSDEQVLETFARQAVFAEETLGEFLPLIGISPLFANLSYSYLHEFRAPQLASGSITIAERLKYQATAALSR